MQKLAIDCAPLVSIITPTLNRAKIIPDAIKSVLGQTMTHWEHIIVDDGSMDNTEDVVRRFPDHRIIYINRFKQRGISDARNLGLRLASGKYIVFLDSDDTFPKDSLAIRVKFMEKHPSLAMVCGQGDVVRSQKYLRALEKIDPTKKQTRFSHNASDALVAFKKLKTHKARYHLLLEENFILTGTVMLRRKVLEKIGSFDTNFVVAEDYDLWLRVARNYDYAALDEVLVNYRRFDDSIYLDARKKKIHLKYVRLAQTKQKPWK